MIISCLFFQGLPAQEIIGPGKILGDFEATLAKTENIQADTLSIYNHYLDKLINRGNYISADSILTGINSSLDNIQPSSLKASIIKNRAYMYKVQRRYDKALEDYLWLKAFYEETNDLINLGSIYTLLAEYYRALGQNDLFGKHLKLAQNIYEKTTPTNEALAYWYSRKVAWCTEAIRDGDSLLYYAERGLELLDGSDEVLAKSLILNELGFNGPKLKFDRAKVLGYFHQSRDLLWENERYRDYVDVVNNLGRYHTRAGNTQEAITMLEDILIIEEANDWFEPLKISYRLLTSLYRTLGQNEKVVEYTEKELRTTIKKLNAVHAIEINDLALNYEKDLIEAQLQVQEQETFVARTEAARNLRAFVITLLAAGVLMLIAAITYHVNRRFKKKNQLLSEQRLQIKKTNDELEKALNKQHILFKELNHRVKNNLSILTGLIYLHEVEEPEEGFKKTLSAIRMRIKSMALAHDNIYKSEEADKVNFGLYLKELFQELRTSLANSEKIETQIESQNFELELQRAIPLSMVINELFTNSVKHGFKDSASGKISVKTYAENKDIILEYKDNGIGFSMNNEKPETMGLGLVNLLLEQLDAELTKIPEESGVHYIFRIPDVAA